MKKLVGALLVELLAPAAMNGQEKDANEGTAERMSGRRH